MNCRKSVGHHDFILPSEGLSSSGPRCLNPWSDLGDCSIEFGSCTCGEAASLQGTV